jgi:hypothetical protein
MSIDKFLATEQGAKALKAKLKAMPEHEKAKPSYAVLWKKTCEAVNQFNLEKMKKQLKDGVTSSAPAKEDPPLEPKPKAPVTKLAPTAPSSEARVKEKQLKKKNHINYSKDEILAHIKELEEKHPALFSLENPKPIKVGIDKDIQSQLNWDESLIKAVMLYYVTRENYNYNFLNETKRYDLDGKETNQVIDKEHYKVAKKRLNFAVGRFEMEKKYPQLMIPFPKLDEPVPLKNGVTLYYSSSLVQEVLAIVKDCYGIDAKVKKKGAQDESDSSYHMNLSVIKNGEVIHEVKTIRKSKKEASGRCYFKMYMKLVKEIKAYSFDYELPVLKKKD